MCPSFRGSTVAILQVEVSVMYMNILDTIVGEGYEFVLTNITKQLINFYCAVPSFRAKW